MDLSEEDVKAFKVAAVHEEPCGKKIRCIAFSRDGEEMVASSDNDQIAVFDCTDSTLSYRLNCKKYGVDLLEYLHDEHKIVHTSSKIDDTVRYLNIQTNKYIRYFTSHVAKVVSLSPHPTENGFISCSQDRTLRIWDVRAPCWLDVIYVATTPVASYDCEGLIFAVALNSENIELYDLRAFGRGPFSRMRFKRQINGEWTGLKFSANGRNILISTNTSAIHLVDVFTDTMKYTFTDFDNHLSIPLEASFTPDSKFILSGSVDAKLHLWSTATGNKVCALDGDFDVPINCIRCNPKLNMFASAGTSTHFWLHHNSLEEESSYSV